MGDAKAVHMDHFYLNLVILNKSDMVGEKVKEKAGSGIFGRMAGKAANVVISDSKITAELSKGLKEKLIATTQEMGLDLSFDKAFQRKNLAVFKVTLLHVDKKVLLKTVKGDQFSEKFEVLLSTMQDLGLDAKIEAINEGMGDIIIQKLMERLEEVLPEKLFEQGVKCAVSSIAPAEQGDHFFAFLGELDLIE